MMHGFQYHGFGINTGWLLGGILRLFFIIGIVLLILFLTRRQSGRDQSNTQELDTHNRIMAILNHRYEDKQISFEEYEERRLILEGCRFDDCSNPELIFLKEKYSRSEIISIEYIEKRNHIICSG